MVWLLCSNPQSHFLLLYRILLVRDRGGADRSLLTHFVTLGESWLLCRELPVSPRLLLPAAQLGAPGTRLPSQQPPLATVLCH